MTSSRSEATNRRGGEYRRCAELIQRKGIPPVTNLAAEVEVDWQRTGIDLPRCQCRIDAIEFAQGQVDRGGARLLDRESGRDAGLSGFGQHTDFPSGKLRQLGDLLPGHDEGVGERLCWGRQYHDALAFEDFFRDRHDAGMGEFPVAANEPGRRFRPPDGNRRQAHIDAIFVENAGCGAEPSRALPCREQPGRGAHGPRARRALRPGEMRSGRGRARDEI